MNFKDFLNKLAAIETVTLTGNLSHQKMMPVERNSLLKISNTEPKKAAVGMLFYPKNNETFFVLIMRNTYKGVHSAQVAFPGGKYEDNDGNLENTALRETFEEIGVPIEYLEVVKQFSGLLIPVSNFEVTPFLMISKTELKFIPQIEEVSQIFEIALDSLLADTSISHQTLDTSYATAITVPIFDFDGLKIWGATAMMLSELKDVLKQVL